MKCYGYDDDIIIEKNQQRKNIKFLIKDRKPPRRRKPRMYVKTGPSDYKPPFPVIDCSESLFELNNKKYGQEIALTMKLESIKPVVSNIDDSDNESDDLSDTIEEDTQLNNEIEIIGYGCLDDVLSGRIKSRKLTRSGRRPRSSLSVLDT